jgi:CheY-like chemotaxis protein
MARVVIFDEPDSIERLRRQVEMLGHEVTGIAVEAYSVFAAVDQGRPDLIVLGMSLPGSGGVETLLRMRRDPRTAGKPLVALVLSTEWDEIIPKHALTRLLQKPTDLETMKFLFDELFQLAPPAAPPAAPAEPELEADPLGPPPSYSKFGGSAAMDMGAPSDDDLPPGETIEL